MTEENTTAAVNTVDFDFDALDKKWADAPIQEGFEEIPNGKYIVKVDKVELAKSKTSNIPMLKVQVAVASGKYKKRKLFTNMLISGDNEVSLKILKNFFAKAGIKGTLKECIERRAEVLDKFYDVQKAAQTNDPARYNLYFNAVVEAPTEDDEPVTASTTEVPF